MKALVALACLAVLPAAAASHEQGCTQQAPCPWPVTVTASGLEAAVLAGNWTVGMWVQLSVLNDDEANHTLQVEGHGIRFEAAGLDITESPPFNLTKAGTFTLRDLTTGASARFTVQPLAASTSATRGADAVGALVLALAVAGFSRARR